VIGVTSVGIGRVFFLLLLLFKELCEESVICYLVFSALKASGDVSVLQLLHPKSGILCHVALPLSEPGCVRKTYTN
jgi:hypothetical protein